MSVVDLKSVNKLYGDVRAVDSLDLTIESGEFVTLLGPFGCGKTTTLRMAAGFIRPTSGTIVLGGEDVTGVPPHRRLVGLVFQNYALFPHMDVRRNVEFGLRMAGVPSQDRSTRVEEALAMVRLEGMTGRKPSQLSGGTAAACRPGARPGHTAEGSVARRAVRRARQAIARPHAH